MTTSEITLADRWGHFLARWGYRRMAWTVEPGLYAIGAPTKTSPVFVTANYTLSFDALRAALRGIDGYLLVLDTQGVNVWCAAGKGTFGTDELTARIGAAHLKKFVSHRRLIVPQLGAPGVAAHEVKKRAGFKVIYGPVRAADLPEFLRSGEATTRMRRVDFPLGDRLVLIPVELVHAFAPAAVAAMVLYLAAGAMAAAGALAAVAAGVVLFPILMPWLPGHDFSSKGFFIGGVVAAVFAAMAFGGGADAYSLSSAGHALACLLAMPPVSAFLALNFTGVTTFASPSQVRKEIFRYAPAMAWLLGAGLAVMAGSALAPFLMGS